MEATRHITNYATKFCTFDVFIRYYFDMANDILVERRLSPLNRLWTLLFILFSFARFSFVPKKNNTLRTNYKPGMVIILYGYYIIINLEEIKHTHLPSNYLIR